MPRLPIVDDREHLFDVAPAPVIGMNADFRNAAETVALTARLDELLMYADVGHERPALVADHPPMRIRLVKVALRLEYLVDRPGETGGQQAAKFTVLRRVDAGVGQVFDPRGHRG